VAIAVAICRTLFAQLLLWEPSPSVIPITCKIVSRDGANSSTPPRISDNTICLTYVQHSHNQTRTVWFSAHYRPLKDVPETHYFTLVPQSADAVEGAEQATRGGPAGPQIFHLAVPGLPVTISIPGNPGPNTPPPNGSSSPVVNAAFSPPNGRYRTDATPNAFWGNLFCSPSFGCQLGTSCAEFFG
jgi:hypothetical protein